MNIIELAREAGFEIDCCSLQWHERIEKFARLHRNATLEEAAAACRAWAADHAKADGCTYEDCDFVAAAHDCAAAVEALKEKT